MKKLVVIGLVSLLVLSSVFAYSCIDEKDNDEVKIFKNNMNLRALENDIKEGLTQEGFALKIKYFNPCKPWQR